MPPVFPYHLIVPTVFGLIFFAFLFLVLLVKLFGKDTPAVIAPEPDNRKDVNIKFEALNDVEGLITLPDGERIFTYHGGYIIVDNMIGIQFYNAPDSKIIEIMDMNVREDSLFTYAPVGSTYRERTDYSLKQIRLMVNQGKIPKITLLKVEQIVRQVDILQRLLKDGTIYQDGYDYRYRA